LAKANLLGRPDLKYKLMMTQ